MFAFVFPGQGSQSIGMMQAYGDNAVVRDTFAEASQVLGEDLWQLVSEGPVEKLALTIYTQPLMLTAGIAVFRAWCAAEGPSPSVVAGHSLGEYSALVAAGSLAFDDAVSLVRFRAQAMQEAVPAGEGAMAALMGLELAAVCELCTEVAQGEVVGAANLNAPGQIVIAGSKAAVERAMVLAKQRGTKRATLLPVSAPFHCDLMKPAAERLAERLARIPVEPPKIAVVNNVDVMAETDPQQIRSALIRQTYSPVRWIETVQAIESRGISKIYECGPGKVLAGMNKRIVQKMASASLHDEASLHQALSQQRG